jgi:hypothetical protein
MKKILILSIFFLALIKANATPPPTDTLLLLKTKIENNKSNFINKPFKVLLDTLKKLKLPIIEYSGAHDGLEGLYNNDTIWVSGFHLFFEEYLGSEKMFKHHQCLADNKGKDTVNTHIKTIRVKFQNPVAYIRAWGYLAYEDGSTEANLDGVLWNRKLANLYKDAIVTDLFVYEY